METFSKCTKRKCSKESGHRGKCDSKHSVNNEFWKRSSVIIGHELQELEAKRARLEQNNDSLQSEVASMESKKIELLNETETLTNEKIVLDEKLSKVTQKFDKLKLLIEQKEYSKTKRQSNPTRLETLYDTSNTQRYSRRNEVKNILEFIHGDLEGAIYGAWDVSTKYASPEVMEKLLLEYKKGKFVEKLYGNFSTSFKNSKQALDQAVAKKYACFLSRRKFNFMCKIQSSTFNQDEQKWSSSKVISYGDKKINLKDRSLSDNAVKKFVDSLDIGDIHPIPGYCGVSRTVTALVTMVIDLHFKVPAYKEKLIWFNNHENHLIFEFSDDGAPECKDTTMSIGSLTLWNLGNRVRSREYQYPLHAVSCGEKEDVMELLWKQHCEEMMLLEGNMMNIDGRRITMEFQPSADQAWQTWANNVLSQSATYPSIFAKVHKSELGIVGQELDKRWQVPSMESRQIDLEKLNGYLGTLSSNLNPEQVHKKKLEFMAKNGLRQLGEPRIGYYADRQRPEPLHLEINNWEHTVNLLYQECVRRNVVDKLILTLNSKVSEGDCGLKSVADNIKQHFSSEQTRYNKLKNRMIGSQAISMAKYGLRAVDLLKNDLESAAERYKRIFLSKIFETLRSIGTMFNSVNVCESYVAELDELCTL